MENIVRTILDHMMSGEIDRTVGKRLLKELKGESLKSPHKRHDIAIVGMAAKMPQANSVSAFWNNIRNGVESITDFPESRSKDTDPLVEYTYLKGKEIHYAKGGYLDEIDKFDYKFFNISPKEASLMDPAQRLFLQTAWNTLEDAGYGGDSLVGSRTGVYVGYSGWPMYGQFVSHVEPSSFELSVMGNISAIITKRIPQLLNFKGPGMLIDTACSSSLVALHLAVQSIRNGECDQAIVGGIRILLMPAEGAVTYGIESKTPHVKVFDEDADGTILSEGVASILIKPLEKALKDKDEIYAVIKGSAINQDGSTPGITMPNVSAQDDVLRRAWKDADIDPVTISYVEAMGMATKLGDPIEIDAINNAFRAYTDLKQFCAVGSLKTNIGHTDSTAGIAAIIKTAMALKHKELPPTLHFKRPNKNINFEQSAVHINDRLIKWESKEGLPRRCGVNSFGFSGTNCHVVLEEAPTIKENFVPNELRKPEVFVLSAKSEEALNQLINDYIGWIEQSLEPIDIRSLCYTASIGRGHYKYRLAFETKSTTELKDRLKILEKEGLANKERGQQDWLYYSHSDADPANRQEDLEMSDNFQQELCRRYVRGEKVSWEEVYPEKIKRIHLPVYPFDKARCWMELPSKPLKSKLNKEISFQL